MGKGKGSKGKRGDGPRQVPEETLIEVRMAKAARVRQRGENPFANDLAGPVPLTDLAVVRGQFDAVRGADDRYDAEKVEPHPYRVAGRILFLRSFGGMTFLRLRDRTGELQLVCDESQLGEAYGQQGADRDRKHRYPYGSSHVRPELPRGGRRCRIHATEGRRTRQGVDDRCDDCSGEQPGNGDTDDHRGHRHRDRSRSRCPPDGDAETDG